MKAVKTAFGIAVLLAGTQVQWVFIPKVVAFEPVVLSEQQISVENEMSGTTTPPAEKEATTGEISRSISVPSYSYNRFRYGYCTYYVASRFPVTWSGDAYLWPKNASQQGYRVDKEPEAGAILVTSENSYNTRSGHVAYIEAVTETTITITEMNFKAWNVVSSRTIQKDSRIIVAVIHR